MSAIALIAITFLAGMRSPRVKLQRGFQQSQLTKQEPPGAS